MLAPLFLGLLWPLVFELIYISKPSLRAFLTFFNIFSPVSSSNIMKRLLYLIDVKYRENKPSRSKPPRGSTYFRLKRLSVSENYFICTTFLMIVSPTRRDNVMKLFFLFMSNRIHQDLYWRKTLATKYLSQKNTRSRRGFH
jgi:hypothetical protein